MATQQLESSKYFPSQELPENRKKATAFGSHVFLAMVLLTACVFAWIAYSRQDLVAVCAVIIVALGAIFGFRRGFIGVCASLFSLGLAAYLAPRIGIASESFFSEYLGSTGILKRMLAIGISGIVCHASLRLISYKLIGKRKSSFSFNKLLGSVAGGLQAAAAVILFLGAYVLNEPPSEAPVQESNEVQDGNYDAFHLMAQQLKTSELCEWVKGHNPFVYFPALNKVDQVNRRVAQLDNPVKIELLLHHPSYQQPEVNAAIRQLLEDPEIVELFKSRQGFDSSGIKTLLRSETVLQLLDQPGFLKTAQEILAAEGEAAE